MKQADAFDPEALRLAGEGLEAPPKRPPKRPPRHRPGEAFLKGPVPWPWLAAAARLPGKALQVSLLLWKVAGCRKSRTVPFCLGRGAEVGVTQKSARLALRALETAGLVAVVRKPGRGLEVTLLDRPGDAGRPCEA
jgi:hypothetical protein